MENNLINKNINYVKKLKQAEKLLETKLKETEKGIDEYFYGDGEKPKREMIERYVKIYRERLELKRYIDSLEVRWMKKTLGIG